MLELVTSDDNATEVFPEQLIAYRVSVLAKILARLAGRSLSQKYGLTIAEWWTLTELDQHSPRTLRWIADATLIDKAQLSRAAASLVERGYIQRRRDPSDARSVLFSITDAGREVSAASSKTRREANQRMLEQLTEEQRATLFASLDRLTDFLLAEDDASDMAEHKLARARRR